MNTCLLLIDAQASFQHRPFFNEALAEPYLIKQNRLLKACVAADIPVIRIFHHSGNEDPHNPFSLASGEVRPMDGLQQVTAAETFYKQRHSALIGTDLSVWLTQNTINTLIISGVRTEQCCETTARHASDLGYQVQYILDATLTFDMQQPDGTTLCAKAIKMRTATVLQDRFADILTTEQWLTTDHARHIHH